MVNVVRSALRRIREASRAVSSPHPFIPVPLYYPFTPRPRYGYDRPAHPQLLALWEAARPNFENLIDQSLKLQDYFSTISRNEPTDPKAPWWNNTWFGSLDAIILTTLLHDKKPALLMEVGSGNSTKYARHAINAFHLPTRIVSIDPQPRAEVDRICDEYIRNNLEDVDLTVFDRLEPGDFLFIDNSHQAFMNSDVTVFFTEVVPRLKAGVVIHVHDIFLPWDYCEEWVERYYNEQYLLACWLLAAKRDVNILFGSYWAGSIDPALRNRLHTLYSSPAMSGVKISGGSFWFTLSR